MALIAEATKLTLLLAYLLLVILTIPLAFDVGGVQCGLLYSLTLFIMYFVLTTLRMLTRHNRYLRIFGALYYGQYIILPSLLMFFLNYCEQKGAGYNPLVNAWKVILSHCTPTFTILEGFCSLLLIQAVGQTLHWFTRYRLDTWLIVSLISSGCIVSALLYFLYRIYLVEFAIGTLLSSLLGLFLTLTFVIGIYGIISKKGLIIESSLLFAYIVKCIYETFPILSQRATELLTQMFTQATINFKQEFPKISPQMLQRAQDLLPVLAQKLPTSFKTIWEFLLDAIEKLTVPLMVNFAYRIGVFYAATKIIPSLYQSAGVHRRPLLHLHHPSALSILSSDSTLSSRPSPPQRPVKQYKPGRLLRLIYAYSPCIIIAVYTHLMLGYLGYLDSELKLWGFWNNSLLEISVAPAQFWNWVNMATTLALYAMELLGNSNEGITTHWKVD
ncbi:hypothetical protein JNB11_03145 [Kocuria palustris]|nr:hypothetical protein [Kocuria palustris]